VLAADVMRRREAVGGLLSLFAAALFATFEPNEALASGRANGRVVESASDSDGLTLELRLGSAPYPDRSGPHADPTVLVFVPAHARVDRSGRVDLVVHFHGHNSVAKEAIVQHRLREQVRASRQNAVLVVPQGPVRTASGDFGKLMRKGGLARLLREVVEVLATKDVGKIARSSGLEDVGLAGAKLPGKVVISSHSGGYRAAAAGATLGGVDVREVYLFDSLYGEVDSFRRFLSAAPKSRKLVSYYVGGRPRELSLELADTLAGSGVAVVRERAGKKLTRAELTRGRAVFLEGSVTHATATWEEFALRDCLFASCLSGRGSKAWHDARDAERAT
jgi:hypothetical protein